MKLSLSIFLSTCLNLYLPETITADPLNLCLYRSAVLYGRVHHVADTAADQLLLRPVLARHVLYLDQGEQLLEGKLTSNGNGQSVQTQCVYAWEGLLVSGDA